MNQLKQEIFFNAHNEAVVGGKFGCQQLEAPRLLDSLGVGSCGAGMRRCGVFVSSDDSVFNVNLCTDV